MNALIGIAQGMETLLREEHARRVRRANPTVLCPTCLSPWVHAEGWVYANGGGDTDSEGAGDYYCADCDANGRDSNFSHCLYLPYAERGWAVDTSILEAIEVALDDARDETEAEYRASRIADAWRVVRAAVGAPR